MSLLKRLKNAFREGRVEFWEGRPDNRTQDELKAAIRNNPRISEVKQMPRESCGGVHGVDGEDVVYSAKLTVARYGRSKEFYLKCFFWKKSDKRVDQGVEVQSFKPWEN